MNIILTNINFIRLTIGVLNVKRCKNNLFKKGWAKIQPNRILIYSLFFCDFCTKYYTKIQVKIYKTYVL